MTLSDLIPFQEAVSAQRVRKLLPTSLDTAGLRELEDTVRRQSFFSARTVIEDLLEQYKKDVEDLLNPRTVVRDGQRVTEGMSLPEARLRAKELLRDLGYSPDPKERGSLKDLSSDRRINLVLETNTQMMQGAGQFIQGQDPEVLDAFPAQELYRLRGSKVERNWPQRWLEAASYSGDGNAARVLRDYGRMVARKDSPIWDVIGSSELFDDGLDNPYPPFAFNSGMWVRDVDFDVAEQMDLVTLDNVPAPQRLDLQNLFPAA